MSETAAFCATCGTLVSADSTAHAERPPAPAAASPTPPPLYWSEPGDHDDLEAAPGQKSKWLSRRTLLIAAGIVLLVILGAVFVHVSFPGAPKSERYTVAEYNRLGEGQSLTQVETILGGPPTKQTQFADGGIVARWTNSDGSYVETGFTNGLLDGRFTAGPHGRGHLGDSGWLELPSSRPMIILISCLLSLLCLYVAALVVGCPLSIIQVLVIAAICGVAAYVCSLMGLAPLIGLLASLVALFTLIQAWTAEHVLDTIFILILYSLLNEGIARFILLPLVGFHMY